MSWNGGDEWVCTPTWEQILSDDGFGYDNAGLLGNAALDDLIYRSAKDSSIDQDKFKSRDVEFNPFNHKTQPTEAIADEAMIFGHVDMVGNGQLDDLIARRLQSNKAIVTPSQDQLSPDSQPEDSASEDICSAVRPQPSTDTKPVDPKAANLIAAASQAQFPVDPETVKYYGFNECFTLADQQKLLGVYATLVKSLNVTARDLDAWMSQGREKLGDIVKGKLEEAKDRVPVEYSA